MPQVKISRLSKIVDSVPEMIAEIGLDKQYRYVNQAFERWFGISRQQIEQQQIASVVGDSVFQRINPFIERALAGETVEYETDLPKKGEMRRVWVRYIPMIGQNEKIDGFIALITDITQRKQDEKERENLHKQLLQAQKMESLGQLTGGIAHDFNNILTSILGYADLAMAHIGNTDSVLKEYLNEVFLAGERAGAMIRQMLTFSRGSPAEFHIVKLPSIVNDVFKMLRPALPARINVVNNIDAEVADIVGDPIQLHQVVLNLCINARDAISDKGSIQISVRKATVSDSKCSSCSKPFRGEYIMLSVKDSGEGIDTEDLPHIFEPFYTTKEAGKGTGMGLSTVHGIVHKHGGHIELINEPNAGVDFRLFFPIATEEEQTPRIPMHAHGEIDTAILKGKRIMIVDDEETVANYIGELLASYDARPRLFSDSVKALNAFEQAPGKYDLICSDHSMSGMTGIELIKKIKAKQPNIPTLIFTGSNEQLDEVSAIHHGASAFLLKPLKGKILTSTIARLLTENMV